MRIVLRALPCVATFTLMAAGAAMAQAPTPDTAVVNSAVRAAKVTYAEVENAYTASRLIKTDTEVVCDTIGDDYGTTFSFFRDSAGSVRLFETVGGTDDHGETIRYYYDASGHLRFAFGVMANVHGDRFEERLYFDDHGVQVRRIAEWVKGNGWKVKSWIKPVFDPVANLKSYCAQK